MSVSLICYGISFFVIMAVKMGLRRMDKITGAMSIIILLILSCALISDLPHHIQNCKTAAILQFFADVSGLNMVLVLEIMLIMVASPQKKYHENLLTYLVYLITASFIFSAILVVIPFAVQNEPYGRGENMIRCYLKYRYIKLFVYDIWVLVYTGMALFVFYYYFANITASFSILRTWLFVPLFIFLFTVSFLVHDIVEVLSGYIPTWDAINSAIGNLWG
eukprot:137646_1